MHQLLRDSLRLVLSRQDPEAGVRLHKRATRWYASVGQLDHTVQRLLLTNDPVAVDEAMWRAAPAFVATGRTATVRRSARATSARTRTRPVLAVTAAWCVSPTATCRPSATGHKVTDAMDERLMLPDGNPVATAAALLRAVEGAGRVDRTPCRRRTRLRAGSRFRSPFRAIARYLKGAALHVEGRRARSSRDWMRPRNSPYRFLRPSHSAWPNVPL